MEIRSVLGLDLGTNSIGWALVEEQVIDGNSRPTRLLDAGVRIFPEGIEATKNESLNVARRRARALRRQHDRRNRRRDALRNRLQRAGLLPRVKAELAAALTISPYQLRTRGLDQKLECFEFGRALYHLGNRRGFKSNRKTDGRADKKKENEGIRTEITDLQHKIESAGARTLGEYLSRLDPCAERIRCRHTSREMYAREYDALWDAQQPHHSAIMIEELRRQIHEIIFHQRPLRVQKNLVGECELEPGRKRSPRGTWYAQQFRLLQDVSHLQFPDLNTGEIRALNDDERAKLVAELQKKEKRTFDQIRETLGLLDSQKFNFETADHRDKLNGNQTEWRLRRIFGKSYEKNANTRDEIVRDLLFLDSEEAIRRHATERWGLDAETAANLAGVKLQSGYMHLSERALRRLIPHLEKGLSYMDSVVAAGYQRPDQRKVEVRPELTREDLPELRNPIVKAALNQMRRVVNAIVREHGKPAQIRVEMARDLKVSLRKRGEILSENRKRRLANEAAAELLGQEFGVSNPTREDLLRHRLWKEQKQTCPYTGRAIAQSSLFSPGWEVDHIIPIPRSGDDSYMNKVLCAAEANREKLNKTPWEAWGGDQRRWGEITLRITNLHLPFAKKRRFLTQTVDEEFLNDFISRQLNDTRYIAREARGYLETLAGKYNVQIGNGVTTAALRRRWGLNKILSDSIDKNRADHRHHAIDAAVIALTTPAVLKKMSQLSAVGLRPEEARFDPPWEHFRDDVKRRIDTLLVSHQVLREVHGALHEETNYGILRDEKGDPTGIFALRKPVANLTQAELARIADSRVRTIVIEHLRGFGADPAKRGAEKTAEWKEAMISAELPCLPNANGKPVPIRRVRLHKPSSGMISMKNRDGVVYRAVDSGSNHHIEIFENLEGKKAGKWVGEVLTMFEAAQRARPPKRASAEKAVASPQPLIQRDRGDSKRFVMSLAINEIVKVVENGQANYWRVQKIDAGNMRITFRPHSDARKSDDKSYERTLMINAFKALAPVKLTIDPLGRERRAHD